jgi:putative NIF3 family GTP cyclohydrolase 1 type 2
MSKRDLNNYLSELSQEQIANQVLELYVKFPDVKTYYDFVFKPNEEKLQQEAKMKISNEYFPVKGKRPKMRRSVAQKIIKHFRNLGVDAFVTADIMLYTIEIAQVYSENNRINSESFYKSFYTAFSQSVSFLIERGILYDFKNRLQKITEITVQQKWINHYEFSSIMEQLDY